jgi:hypothetical protein
LFQIESFCKAYSSIQREEYIPHFSSKHSDCCPEKIIIPRLVLTREKSDVSPDFCFQNFDQDFMNIFVYDQLHTQMLSKKAFINFLEPMVLFPPTFKYDKGSASFDSSKKQRCPAWTDRILFSTRKNSAVRKFSNAGRTSAVEVLDYYSVDVRASDHRPVCGIYSILLE